MSQTFRDIYWEIRCERGIREAEQYKHALERDGHFMYGMAHSSGQAMNGAEDHRLRDHAADAFSSLERREEIKCEEERERERCESERLRRERGDYEMEMYKQQQEEEQEEVQ
jgi:hypothetical protein